MQTSYETDPKRCQNLLQGQLLSEWQRQVKLLRALNRWLKDFLTGPLKEHCQVVSWEGELLTIGVIDSTWAMKLRCLIPELLNGLHYYDQWRRIKQIKTQILKPAAHEPRFTPKNIQPQKKLSSQAQELLKNCASSVKNPRLQEALRKLGR